MTPSKPLPKTSLELVELFAVVFWPVAFAAFAGGLGVGVTATLLWKACS